MESEKMTRNTIDEINQQYQDGLITEEERDRKIIEIVGESGWQAIKEASLADA
jgi:hypothetical protein